MNYVPILPPPPLNRFVERFYYNGIKMKGTHRRTLIPDGKVDIAFLFGENHKHFIVDGKTYSFTNENIILGSSERAREFQFEDEIELIGLRLYPTSCKKIFGISVKEFTGYPVFLSSYFKEPVPEFSINTEEDIVPCLQNLSDWFSSFVPTNTTADLLHDYILQIYATNGLVPLNELCNYSYNEYKKLQRAFFEEIGIRPKQYARMVRFESLHNDILLAKKIDWQYLIVKYGFHDQSHLIKEFKHFTDHTPTTFFAQMNIFV